jgi:hypothetical protein
MKKLDRILSLVALFCLLWLTSTSCAQNIDSVNSHVRASLANLYKKYPQEKIFIHTDADLYANGQTIWYKAYTMAYGKPTDLSRIVYVVLTDSTGKAVLKNKLPMTASKAHGNLELPDSLHSGWYQLTAFTAWMMNFDEEGLFHKRIYVQNLAERLPDALTTKKKSKYHIRFFPEGGDLVEGNLCNIAFKAWDDYGNPAKIEGEVKSSDGSEIAKLTTIHDGMGSFTMEGFAVKSYKAIVRFPDQSEQTISLPPFKRKGLVLRVNSLPADVVEVRLSMGSGIDQYRNIVVAAFQDNGTIKTFPLMLNQGINLVQLKKSDFSTGILRITAFNDQGIPLAERIAFINKDDQLKLSLKASTLSLQPRTKSTFKLTSGLSERQPLSGNFSVTVTDADAVNASEDDNIYTSMLVSSELIGKVYHPAYYFQNNSDSLKEQLDLVMLTNGWRHFKWDAILNNKPLTLKYFVENTQFIVGKIDHYNEKDKLKVKVIVNNADSTKYMSMIEPDTSGRFVLTGYDHQGRAEMLYEVVGKKNRKQDATVKFLNSGIDTGSYWVDTLNCFAQLRPVRGEQFAADTYSENNRRLLTKGIALKTVSITEHRTPLQLLVETHVKHLEATRAYDFDLLNTHPNIFSAFDGGVLAYLAGRVPGLQISGKHFTYHGPSSIAGESSPLFYIDEASATVDEVIDVPMTEIALVRFVPPPVGFAPLNGGAIGAIMIYTKNGNDIKNSPNLLFDSYAFNGYSITREFASPDYGRLKPDAKPDTRTTLFWQHDLDTDNFGEAKFHFYNSDKAKRYRIVIQGMDAEGRIGYLSQVF